MPEVIAIDGPAGAGKSTIARKLADKLNYRYLDTGAMYRVVTLSALKRGINLEDKNKLAQIAFEINIDFLSPRDDGIVHILLNNVDVTEKIRNPEVSRNVSRVAKVMGVRKAMVKLQRQLAAEGQIVVEGRDITSSVLPDADLKLFITASLAERAKRRYNELRRDNSQLTLSEMKRKIKKRDRLDSERKISPLVKTDDAILIDTTDLNIRGVLDYILDIIEKGEGNG